MAIYYCQGIVVMSTVFRDVLFGCGGLVFKVVLFTL